MVLVILDMTPDSLIERYQAHTGRRPHREPDLALLTEGHDILVSPAGEAAQADEGDEAEAEDNLHEELGVGAGGREEDGGSCQEQEGRW